MNKGKHKVNTTKINRKRSPDTGIEPETSTCPESVLTITPPGHLRNLMNYSTIKTQVNTKMYDLWCNAGGARPIKVRNELVTRPWTEHHA